MKQRRLEVGSKESCQRHSQHHTCSFFNHDQVLPILGNLNSKGRSASKGLSSLWLCLMGAAEASLCRKDPNLNMLNKFIDRESPFMSLWNSRDSTRNGSDTRQPVLWSPPFLDTPQQLERVCSRSPASSLGVFLALTKCADMINKSHTGPLEKRETEWNGLQGIKKTSGGGTGACLLRRKWLIETHYYKTLTTGDDCASSPWVQM